MNKQVRRTSARTSIPLFISTLQLALLLSACSPGSSSEKQLATQGLLSGEISSMGKAAVIGSVHHGGSFWNTQKGAREYSWNHKAGEFSSIRASALSGNGQRAVTCEEKNLVLWNTEDGKALQFWQASDRVYTIKLNKDGSKALMGLRDGSVIWFDMNRGIEIFHFNHQNEVRAVDLNEDGNIGISGGDDNIAKIWDLETGKEIRSFSLQNQIKTVALSDSGNLAFTTAQREDSVVWDVNTGKAKFKLPNRYTNYTTADFSDNEKALVAGTFQGEIHKWNINNGSTLNKWKAKPRKAYGSAASKAIIDVLDQKNKVLALTSDGMFEVFQ